MAVVETNELSSLRVKLELPMVDGKVKTRTKSYSYLKHTATAQDAYDVANALMSLQNHDVLEVCKQDNTVISL